MEAESRHPAISPEMTGAIRNWKSQGSILP